jgi:cytoskeletal protein RodZ
MPGLGDEFRAAREARHLSPSDVSEQIHIRSVYLQSIEDEEWSAIAAPVYVRGFIRTYARYLGLDPERAVERFNAALADAGQRPQETLVTAAPPRRRPSLWLWVASVAALLLVGFVGYNYYLFQAGEKSAAPAAVVGLASPAAAVAASAAPVAARPAAPAPAKRVAPPSTTRTLEVRLTQRSWILVNVDGTQRLEGIFPAGTRKEFHGKNALVRAGNAGGVDLKVNGKELGSMGAAGAVIDKTLTLAEE